MPKLQDAKSLVRFLSHQDCLCEGDFDGSSACPNLKMGPKGGYIGLSASSNSTAHKSIVDLIGKGNDKLAGYWVFIDHFWFSRQLGIGLISHRRAMTAPVEEIRG